MDRKDWILPRTPPEEEIPLPDEPPLPEPPPQAASDQPPKRRGRPRKKRRGRPPLPYDGREVFKTRLRPDVVERLRVLGGGWANRGIELLVDHHDRVKAEARNAIPK